jgi:hypothetical protein
VPAHLHSRRPERMRGSAIQAGSISPQAETDGSGAALLGIGHGASRPARGHIGSLLIKVGISVRTMLVGCLTCLICAVAAWSCLISRAAADPATDFPALPLPPAVETLVGFPQPHSAGRATHLELVRSEAEQRGVPPEVADAVVHVESAYDPNAVGAVGEIGLMQVRPETAAVLGYAGTAAGLHEPTTNVRYGVRYLADAWKLANGNLCRALMKYRAGHGEERMSERSVEYCRRARAHLAAIGSPLANAPLPAADYFPDSPQQPVAQTRSQQARLRLASGAGAMRRVSPQELARRAKSRQLWAAHEARLQAITRKLQPAQLRIASGV